MDTLDALVTAVLGYGVVFLGITLLIAVIVIVGKIMVSAQRKAAAPVPATPAEAPAPVPAPPAPKAPGTAGDLKLYDTPEATAAMIMAIVADELKIPVNELRFISIREVNRK